MTEPRDELVDEREHGFWILSNEIFDRGLVASIHATAFTVYAFLARKAFRQTATACPGIATIARHCGLGQTAVKEALRVLEEHRLISVTRANGKGNVYTLLDRRHWHIPTGSANQAEIRPGRNPTQSESGSHPVGFRPAPGRIPTRTGSDSDPEQEVYDKTSLTRGEQEVAIREITDRAVEIVEAVCRAQGSNPGQFSFGSAKAQQLAVARRLVADGVTADDAGKITTWLLSQGWVNGGVDLPMVEKYVGRWAMAGRPSVAPQQGRKAPTSKLERSRSDLLEIARRERERESTNHQSQDQRIAGHHG